MVAEDLVELDELAPVLLQPGCEALVELGARRFRERLVGGVTDQEVAEAEAVLACELRPVRPDQLLADERGEVRRHLGLVGCERLDGAAMEDLALDRTPLEDAAFGGLELIEARREQRLQRGRNDHLAVRLAGHRQHLLDEERVAARGASDLLAQLAGDPLRDELLDVVVAEGSSRSVTGQAGRRSLSSGRAMQSSRIDAPEERSATCSIRSRNVSSPHWMSSNTTTSGRSAAACSSVLRKAQAISSAEVAASLSPSSERIAAAAASSGGSTSSCFSTSTTGQ